MSGECEKCGEHCIDCQCSVKHFGDMTTDTDCEKNVMEWIGIEEDLPEDNKIVLVSDELNNFVTLGKMQDVGDEFHFALMNLDNVEIDSVITHWMPLPEPPK